MKKNQNSITLTAAIEAVRGIESSYGAAARAILEYALDARASKVTKEAFESGLAQIAQATPGIARVSVSGYLANARRIFAAPKGEAEAAAEKGGGLQAIAKALPPVQRTKAIAAKSREATKAEEKEPASKAPSLAPTTPKAALAALENDLLALRQQYKGRKAVLALVGEIEDLLDDLKNLIN